MTRKSKSVSLALLSSSLLLAGCVAHKRPCTTTTQATQPDGYGQPSCTGGRSGGGGYYYHHTYVPWGYSWGSGGGARQPGPVSGRPGGAIRSGGFGSVGHAMSGGS
jgi:hypothetical protein